MAQIKKIDETKKDANLFIQNILKNVSDDKKQFIKGMVVGLAYEENKKGKSAG